MKQLYLLLLSFMLAIALHAQDSTKVIIVDAYVFDSVTNEALPNLNIVNKNSRKGTISNEDGFFRISIQLNDTISISAIGYREQNIHIDYLPQNDILEIDIPMVPMSYEMDELVLKKGDWNKFKYEFMNLNPEKEENKPIQIADVPLYPVKEFDTPPATGPASMFYHWFGKKPRQNRKKNRYKRKRLKSYQINN